MEQLISREVSPKMTQAVRVRPIEPADLAAWTPLWDGYNAFYGREGPTALLPEITAVTWRRFYDANEPVFALVAESAGRLVGLTHYLFHRSTTRIESTCYLQDLFTAPEVRGQGVGRALIFGVYQAAKAAGVREVYWQTHETNSAGRLLYDKVAKHVGYIVYEQEV
jgi:GNAT superfamily N-acetyltransferase